MVFSVPVGTELIPIKRTSLRRGNMGRVDKGVVAARASASSMILCNAEANKDEIIADLRVLPWF
ncbi:hypothetical protein Hanom_Chr01g00089861 [Helianthus anomalus]